MQETETVHSSLPLCKFTQYAKYLKLLLQILWPKIHISSHWNLFFHIHDLFKYYCQNSTQDLILNKKRVYLSLKSEGVLLFLIIF